MKATSLRTVIRKAIIGSKMEIKARIYRASTGKWSKQETIASGYRGGLIEPFRFLFHKLAYWKSK